MIKAFVTKKEKISHNTWTLTVDLEQEISYENGYFFNYIYNEKEVHRKPYTPVLFDQKQMTFLIKHYNHEGVADYIISKNVGETLMMTMPIYKIERKFHTKQNVLLLAGGTGIAPMLQIMNYSQSNVNYIVIFSNTTVQDIIINEEILKTKANLKIYNIISNKNDDIKDNLMNSLVEFDNYLVYSRLSIELIKQISKENEINMFDFVYCCGPRDYMNDVCGIKNKDKTQGELTGFLKELGYDKNKVFKF